MFIYNKYTDFNVISFISLQLTVSNEYAQILRPTKPPRYISDIV